MGTGRSGLVVDRGDLHILQLPRKPGELGPEAGGGIGLGEDPGKITTTHWPVEEMELVLSESVIACSVSSVTPEGHGALRRRCSGVLRCLIEPCPPRIALESLDSRPPKPIALAREAGEGKGEGLR